MHNSTSTLTAANRRRRAHKAKLVEDRGYRAASMVLCGVRALRIEQRAARMFRA